MSNRILSTGSAAAVLAALVFFAGQDSAAAARCPLGEIYRPSRGVCVSKARAIQAGIYHHSARGSREDVRTESAASSEPKPRPEQALAAIEKRAPAVRATRTGQGEEALAYATDAPKADAAKTEAAKTEAAKPQSVADVTPAVPAASLAARTARLRPVAFTRPVATPFGSLVALEPMP